MDRDIPAFNRPIMDRINAKNHQLHLKRLKKIKNGVSSNKSYHKPNYTNLNNSNSITSTNPNKLPPYNDIKKQLLQQQKRNQIQRQNALLFNKMIKIMKRPDKNNDPLSSIKPHPTTNAAKQRISMQFSRINQQNKTFYHRLQKQKPTIDNKKLEQQRLKNLNILKFLGKYPNNHAVSRASSNHHTNTTFYEKSQQYRTFQLRNKKMNSTGGGIVHGNNHNNHIRYYNNINPNSMSYNNNPHNLSNRNYEQEDYSLQQEKYNRFRNQITNFDNQFKELKTEQYRMNNNQHNVSVEESQKKFVSTMGNFHRNQNQVHSHPNGQHHQPLKYNNVPQIPSIPKPNHLNTNFRNTNTNFPSMNRQNNRNNNFYNEQSQQFPNRRKFLSQGANRTTKRIGGNDGHQNQSQIQDNQFMNNNNMMMGSYNSQQHRNPNRNNEDDQHNIGSTLQQERQQLQQPYPYFLNHPSNNIAIDDIKRRSIQVQKLRLSEGHQYIQQPPKRFHQNLNNNDTLLNGKPPLPKQQRKLNSRNSKADLNTNNLEKERQLNQKLAVKKFINNSNNHLIGVNNNFKNKSNLQINGQQELVPRFIQSKNNNHDKQQFFNDSSINKNTIKKYYNQPPKKPYFGNVSHDTNINSKKPAQKTKTRNSQTNLNPANMIQPQHRPSNGILLYKTSAKLFQLLLVQQKEMIVEQLFTYFYSQQQIQTNQQLQQIYNSIKQALNITLSQYTTQITVNRMTNTYNIKISKFSKSNTNKRQFSDSNKQHQNNGISVNLQNNKQISSYLKEMIEQKLNQIQEMEIPQSEGSILLEEIDYDYKYLVKQMVKIEKDSEEQQEMERNIDHHHGYKLVIVLRNDNGEENRKNDVKTNQQGQQKLQEYLQNGQQDRIKQQQGEDIRQNIAKINKNFQKVQQNVDNIDEGLNIYFQNNNQNYDQYQVSMHMDKPQNINQALHKPNYFKSNNNSSNQIPIKNNSSLQISTSLNNNNQSIAHTAQQIGVINGQQLSDLANINRTDQQKKNVILIQNQQQQKSQSQDQQKNQNAHKQQKQQKQQQEDNQLEEEEYGRVGRKIYNRQQQQVEQQSYEQKKQKDIDNKKIYNKHQIQQQANNKQNNNQLTHQLNNIHFQAADQEID